MMRAASSIEEYAILASAGSIPSLTIKPLGLERSTIRCHLLGLLCLGVTPKRLNLTDGGKSLGLNGPEMLPNFTSTSRYCRGER